MQLGRDSGQQILLLLAFFFFFVFNMLQKFTVPICSSPTVGKTSPCRGGSTSLSLSKVYTSLQGRECDFLRARLRADPHSPALPSHGVCLRYLLGLTVLSAFKTLTPLS